MTTSAQTTPHAQPNAGPRMTGKGWTVLAAVLAIQLLLVLLAVLPQLSPRVSGTEIQLRVAPIDPIDPFRGAYADMSYPDLPGSSPMDERRSEDRGLAYVPLTQEGDVWVGGPIQRSQPDGLFLKCNDDSWRLRCGIESLFANQDRAIELERELGRSEMTATIKVDRWGNAALLGVEEQR